MFYKKRIEALEERVTKLEIKFAELAEKERVQCNEMELLWAKVAEKEKAEAQPTPQPTKPRRRRRKSNGKEANNTNE